MVKFDRRFSAFSSRFQSVVKSPRFATVSPKVRALNTASPRVRAIVAGGALAVLTGVAGPVALTHSGHQAYASPASNSVAMAMVANTSTAPSNDQLHPGGINADQSDLSLSADQLKNAQQIVQAGKAMGLPPRAWVIAVATSMQETKLNNYGNLGSSNDQDSLGLFQQRPSSGWGSAQQVMDPTYSAQSFYKALIQVPGWDKMPLTDAAQAVQVSAFGDRYAQWEAKAGDVVNSVYGQGPLADHKAS
jgi:hypothetical protein